MVVEVLPNWDVEGPVLLLEWMSCWGVIFAGCFLCTFLATQTNVLVRASTRKIMFPVGKSSCSQGEVHVILPTQRNTGRSTSLNPCEGLKPDRDTY